MKSKVKIPYHYGVVVDNIHGSRNKNKEGETCHDRMVRQAEQYANNALNGEKDVKVDYI